MGGMNSVCGTSSIARPSALPRKPADAPPFWAGALELPAYVWGGGSAALATVSGYADRFPAGGVTINPTGIIRNPEWTRNLESGQPLRDALPIVAAFAAGINAVRGAVELTHGMRTGSTKLQLAGGVDLLLAATSALQIASPGLAGAASLALTAARIGIEFS